MTEDVARRSIDWLHSTTCRALALNDVLPSDVHSAPDNPYARRWAAPDILRTMNGWLFPYLKSRVLPGDFHPIIAYLFTEWKCNLDCFRLPLPAGPSTT